MTIAALAFSGLFVLILLWMIALFNGIKRKEIECDQAWSDIDVQLKRRYDLIPNLVSTVKGYASHEKETLEQVISARAAAIDSTGIAAQGKAEGELSQALGRLMMLSESYPDLKANQNFLQLQEELTSTENKIGFSRQHYNGSAAQYNTAIQTFPGVIVASLMGFGDREYFEIEVPEQREAPKVEF
ncbi:MAG: LemA family protein [Planctomycetes bacterium]|nr:LemA family protein [Planctomycetota bacterium]NOG53259.1 LemA family protein [Planctomycetota bacterium]